MSAKTRKQALTWQCQCQLTHLYGLAIRREVEQPAAAEKKLEFGLCQVILRVQQSFLDGQRNLLWARAGFAAVISAIPLGIFPLGLQAQKSTALDASHSQWELDVL
ncbi:TPA: hypothetical protein ACH3X2_007215 [Trebouxia sp. C0005]